MNKNKLKMFVKSWVCTSVCLSGGLYVYKSLVQKKRINILMYHKIDHDNNVLGLSITPDLFAEQIRYLTKHYAILSMDDALSRLEGGSLERGTVVITFDDGYRDNYINAYPILQKFQVPATIFITHDAIETGTFGWHRFDMAIMTSMQKELDLSKFGLGLLSLVDILAREKAVIFLHSKLKKVADIVRSKVVDHVLKVLGDPAENERIMLTWDEIREMQRSGLITIGAHTLSHPILTQVTPDIAMQEISDSKRLLEDKISCPVEFFAYPNGGWEDFNDDIVSMVKKCGYRAACSTISGAQFNEINMFCLPRMDITENICCGVRGHFSENLFSVHLSGLLDRIFFRT